MQRLKSTPQEDLILVDESASSEDRESAVNRLAFDGCFSILEPELEKWLNHKDFILKGKALKVLLGRMGKEKYIDEAIEILQSDKNWSVRTDFAYALKQLAGKFEIKADVKEKVVKALTTALMNDEEPFVQQSSYAALLELIKGKKNESDSFDREKDVDWEILQPYLKKYDLQNINKNQFL